MMVFWVHVHFFQDLPEPSQQGKGPALPPPGLPLPPPRVNSQGTPAPGPRPSLHLPHARLGHDSSAKDRGALGQGKPQGWTGTEWRAVQGR